MIKSGYKVREIIENNFDTRMESALIKYIISIGWDNVVKITDEEIAEIKDKGIITKSFAQELVKTARLICKTCNLYKDFLPFIVNYLYVQEAPMSEIVLCKDDFTYGTGRWDELMHNFDTQLINKGVDESSVKEVQLNATIINLN